MDQNTWAPADLLQLSGGYWSACALHAGVELDVFTPLADTPSTGLQLATRLMVPERSLSMLLNALCAMNLLNKQDAVFSATTFAADFLSRDSDRYLGHIIRHHHHLMTSWSRLDEGVRIGGPVAERYSHGDDETARESFLLGMFNLAMLLAPRVASAIDLSGRTRLLDLGGGPGTYAIHFCQQNPQMQSVIFDLPTTRTFAESTVSRFGLADRITFHPGDFVADELPSGFDAAWLSHVLHSEGPAECGVVLRKVIQSLEPGGILLIQEFVLDDTLDGPLFPALFSLNMLLATPNGQAYSSSQLATMLHEAGAVDVRRIPVDLPNGAAILAGIKPR